MEKLERQQRELRDRYSTEQLSLNEAEFKQVINATSTLDYAIRKGETLEQYVTRLEIYVKLAHKKNWKVHVLIGSKGKPWYQHSNSNGCFMCEDTNLIHYMLNIIRYTADKQPSMTLLS